MSVNKVQCYSAKYLHRMHQCQIRNRVMSVCPMNARHILKRAGIISNTNSTFLFNFCRNRLESFAKQSLKMVSVMGNEEMTLLEHLTELRKRLIVVAFVFVAGLILGFLASPAMLDYISSYTLPKHISWNVFSFTDGF